MKSITEVLTATVKLSHDTLDAKLVTLSVKDDIEAYVVNFERFVSAHKICKG